MFRLGWTGVLDELVAVDEDDEDDDGDGEDCMVVVSAVAPVDCIVGGVEDETSKLARFWVSGVA